MPEESVTAQCTDTECENVSRVNKPGGQLGYSKLLIYRSNSADVHHNIILTALTRYRSELLLAMSVYQ